MKLSTFTTSLVIFLVLIFPALLSLIIKTIPEKQQSSLDGTIKLFGERKIAQKIAVSKNNFSGIGISVRNPNYINKNDLIFTVYSEDNLTLRQMAISGLHINDGDLLKINFPPISDSANKNFTIEFTSPKSSSDQYFEIFISNKNNEKSKGFKLYESSGVSDFEGSIAYEIFNKSENPLSLIYPIYSNVFIRLIKDPFFSAIYFTLIISLFFVYLKYPRSDRN